MEKTRAGGGEVRGHGGGGGGGGVFCYNPRARPLGMHWVGRGGVCCCAARLLYAPVAMLMMIALRGRRRRADVSPASTIRRIYRVRNRSEGQKVAGFGVKIGNI